MTCLFAGTYFELKEMFIQGSVHKAPSCFIYKAAEVAINLFEKAF